METSMGETAKTIGNLSTQYSGYIKTVNGAAEGLV
jgi:hypothetical protein